MGDPLSVATSIEIAAPIARVWDLVSKFDRYADWNAVLTILEGIPEPGRRVRARAAEGTPAEREFEGSVVEVASPGRLVWEGGDPVQFFGRHVFELTELDGTTTRVHNSETFTGEMAAAALSQHREAVLLEFVAFNEALKAAAEAGGSSGTAVQSSGS